jgi:Tfp pilus assembly protein FimT
MNIRLLAVALSAALLVSGAPAVAQGTKVVTIEVWANDTAARYDGRIPRTVYLEEMSRRYDADGNRVVTREVYLNDWNTRWATMDPYGRGLSPAEVSQLTHNVDSNTSGIPRSGSGVQPGNMGPANSKGQ